MNINPMPAVGDRVVVDAELFGYPLDEYGQPTGCLATDQPGEVVEWDGQSYVVALDDGHRCDALPDQLRVVANVPAGYVPVAELLNHIPPDRVLWSTWAAGTARPAPIGAADLGDFQDESGPRYESTGFTLREGADTMHEEIAAGETVYLALGCREGSVRHGYDDEIEGADPWPWASLARGCDALIYSLQADGDTDYAASWYAVRLASYLPVNVFHQAVDLIRREAA